MTVAGMTLIVVDGSGRLSEFHAVPQPVESDNAPPNPTDWPLVFSVAGLDLAAFKEIPPMWIPNVYADERRAWEGPIAELPGETFRVEAAALRGRLVSFALVGPWSRSARASQPVARGRFAAFLDVFTGLVMPGLMLAAVVLAWRNVKNGFGDRRGAMRAAAVIFVLELGAWLIGTRHVGAFGTDFDRFLGAIGRALFDAGLLWVTYLGLEPYVRRFSPDSLIGWTRILKGQWRDPQVASDVLLGVCAGLGMTLFYAVHNIIPPLLGRPEPMPLFPGDYSSLLGVRFVFSRIFGTTANALSSGMLAVAGVVAILILVKRKPVAHVAASVIFVWVVIQNMFPQGTPVLDIAIGLGIIGIWTGVILYGGLLATVAALTTHFLLLRAPITTDFSSWRATPGITYLLVIGGVGLLAAYLARTATGVSRTRPT
jgi:serine/threonine-protein kinase